MLILSRKPGEAIVLGDDIRLVVLGYERGAVRLGIEAPRNVTIMREEVLASISAENHRAADQVGEELVAIAPPKTGRS